MMRGAWYGVVCVCDVVLLEMGMRRYMIRGAWYGVGVVCCLV